MEFETSKERIQETYVIDDLTLSKLFKEVLSEIRLDILPILNIRILLYVIQSISFVDEAEGIYLSEDLNECMKHQLYGISSHIYCPIVSNIKELQRKKSFYEKSFTINGWVPHNRNLLLRLDASSLDYQYKNLFHPLAFLVYPQ